MRLRLVTLRTALLAAVLSGCSMPRQTVQQYEEFTANNVYAQSFPGSADANCEAARRALLSQGYVISEASASLVRARKNFQPDREHHMQIEFYVTCAPNPKGSHSTTVFANAVRETYSLRKSSNSASLGVGSLGSVSLPFGSTDESLVRVASETIPSQPFYARFFELVESYLDYTPDDQEDDRSQPQPPEPAGNKDAGQ